jgi:heme-degrading monooxygenase HmoA
MNHSSFTPYYAVIFTSIKSSFDEGYSAMANYMNTLAASQPGFIGIESAREEIGITVSYWQTLEDIHQWKNHMEHQIAQKMGKSTWYESYTVRICKVERAYSFHQ